MALLQEGPHRGQAASARLVSSGYWLEGDRLGGRIHERLAGGAGRGAAEAPVPQS